MLNNINFDNIQTLISDINNNRRCLKITNLSLSTIEDDGDLEEISNDTNQTRLLIDTQIYYWKNE